MNRFYFSAVLFFSLFCFCAFSLNAQTPRDVRVFVPPVSGEGRAGDSNFFYQQLTYEVIFQHHSLVRSQKSSDFTLRGVISPEAQVNSRGYVFYLEMINSDTDVVVAQQSITYTAIGSSVIELISIIVYNMLSTVPQIDSSGDWRHNYLYFSGGFAWMPRLYLSETDTQSIYGMNFGLGFSLSFHFLDWMAAGAGFQFSQDWVTVNAAREHRDLILEMPITLRFIFKPGNFMLEPYTGVSLNFSMMQATQTSLFSWLIGFQFGVQAGPGIIVIDPRFSVDLAQSLLPPLNNTQPEISYHRTTIQIGIGYKIGFLPKRNIRDY
ncbi:MAG: hypothetical protein FWC21_03345 [Treponema sp.]|nr:hypothetical protein [Treponema sp.]